MIQKALSKEIIRYGISGILISLVNLGVYTALVYLSMRYEIANIIALVLSRIVGFALNKYFVFRSTSKGHFWREFWGFMVARGLSGLVDYFGVILLVDQLHVNEVLSKGFVMIFVIVLNYLLGKFLVFQKKESTNEPSVKSENEQKYFSKNPLRTGLVQRFANRLISEVMSAQTRTIVSDSASVRVDILDAGCGEGFLIQSLHCSVPDRSLIGLDTSQAALDHAKQRNPEITFLLGSIYALPFEDHSVHTILLSEVLEHLSDPVAALSEVQRVAASTIVISVPHEPWFRLGNLLTFRHVSRLGNPAGHIQHWSYRRFQSFIRQNLRGTARFYRSFPWSIAVIDQSMQDERTLY